MKTRDVRSILPELFSGELVHRYPLYAAVLSRMDVVADPRVHVMAVSRRGHGRFALHVNPDFVHDDPKHVLGVLLHEVHHVVLGHVSLAKFRRLAHPDLLEIAMEVSANEFVREPLPGRPVLLREFADYGLRPGQSTLERYRMLVEARLHGDHEIVFLARGRMVDCHHEEGVGSIFRPHIELDPTEAEALERLLERAEQGAPLDALDDEESDGRGKLAGRSARQLTLELRDGEGRPRASVDWRAVLRMFVSRLRTPQDTYARPNRRFPELLGQVPGRSWQPKDRPSLLVAIDTSGSMKPPELEEIARQLDVLAPLVHVTIVECDKAISRTYPFDGTLRHVIGRGGTDLRPVFAPDFLDSHDPDGIVYFTDGEGPYPDVDPGVPTLWVLTKPTAFACPWGQRTRLEV